jgi:hypothetical protein
VQPVERHPIWRGTGCPGGATAQLQGLRRSRPIDFGLNLTLLFVTPFVVTVPLGRAAVIGRVLPIVSRSFSVTARKSSIADGGDPIVIQRVQLVAQDGDHRTCAFEHARHLDVSGAWFRLVAAAEPFEERVDLGRQISQLAAQREPAIDRSVIPRRCSPVSPIGGFVPQTGGRVADRSSLVASVCGPSAACSCRWSLAHSASPGSTTGLVLWPVVPHRRGGATDVAGALAVMPRHTRPSTSHTRPRSDAMDQTLRQTLLLDQRNRVGTIGGRMTRRRFGSATHSTVPRWGGPGAPSLAPRMPPATE